MDLTTASSGEWFLDGRVLKASSVYVIQRDGTRHTLTIRSVPVSLHGAELKFVANGIESSIRMEVRGRDPVLLPQGFSRPRFLRDRGGTESLQSQGSWEVCCGSQSSWIMWGQVVGCARPCKGVSGGRSKESELRFCVCAPPLASPLPSSLLADSFSSSTSCPVSSFLASRSLLHDIRLFLLCPLSLCNLQPLPHIHTLLSTPSSHFPTLLL